MLNKVKFIIIVFSHTNKKKKRVFICENIFLGWKKVEYYAEMMGKIEQKIKFKFSQSFTQVLREREKGNIIRQADENGLPRAGVEPDSVPFKPVKCV